MAGGAMLPRPTSAVARPTSAAGPRRPSPSPRGPAHAIGSPSDMEQKRKSSESTAPPRKGNASTRRSHSESPGHKWPTPGDVSVKASSPAVAMRSKSPRPPSRSASRPASRPASRGSSARSKSIGKKEELEDRLETIASSRTSNRVRVVVRLRPPSVRRETDADLNAVQHDVGSRLLWVLPGPGASKPHRRQFDADGMIAPNASNAQAFAEVIESVEAPLAGTPGCVVAYGATGTGKTHTLFAPDGLVVQAAMHLFGKQEGLRCSVQFVEVYFEMLRDLLDPVSHVTLRGGGRHKTIVYGTVPLDCTSTDGVTDALRTGLAVQSADEPHTCAIFILNVSLPGSDAATPLYFVELPGSEGLKAVGVEGVQLAELVCAYKSLSTFERTLKVIADKKIKTKPPLRESKLTRVLSDVFYGGGKMSVLVHIGLGAAELSRTNASLELLQFAMRVSLKEAKNEKGLDQDTVSKDLQNEIDAFDEASHSKGAEVEAALRAEIVRAGKGVDNAAALEKQVAQLAKDHDALAKKASAKVGAKSADKPSTARDPEELKIAAETHDKIMAMRAQLDAARKLRDEVTVMLPEIAAEYRELGGHAWHNGDTAKTEMYYDKALAAYTKCMGKDHPEVACSMGDLANVYCDQSRFGDAIRLYQAAYRIHIDAFGPDHVDTAGDLASLGLVYSVQGKHKEALPLLKYAPPPLDAYKIMERHLEDDHPNLLQVATFMEKSQLALKKK
ncbi:P-loop containing nucleoside triphosphate hydrolase protein [Pavlovales sp. CCMP2436]|nr:P-loop containing nucleoside triphosphate hydrolase protein [Pavlovales sp. CCMP2436]